MLKLKKMLAVLVCAAMALTMLPSITAGAEKIKYEDFIFDTDTGYITKYTSSYGGDLVIPSTINGCEVIGLGKYAFAEEGSGTHNINSVVFPETLKSIGERAFSTSAFISTLNLPNSLERIEKEAFCACHRLQKVVIPDSVTELGSGAFEACTGLNYVTVGGGITNIPDKAFSGMGYNAWAELYLTENVTSISENAFGKDWCNKITIFAPKGSYAIDYAVSHTIPYKFYPDEGQDVEYIDIDDSDIDYDSLVFGDLMFDYNTGELLTCVTLTDNIVIPSIINGQAVITIADGAFENMLDLESITIPTTVKHIGIDAFAFDESLTELIIPNSVEDIGGGAFAYCTGLKKIIIPDSVTSIGEGAFDGCVNVAIYAPKDSAAIEYAIDNGIPFKYYPEEDDSDAPTWNDTQTDDGPHWENTQTGSSTFTVNYDANGGSGAPSSQTKKEGKNLQLSSKIPSRTGYVFRYWNTDKNGNGITYSPESYYSSEKNVTLYAQWETVRLTVTYNANGGKIRNSAGSYVDSTKMANVAYSYSYGTMPKPTRDGYEFDGWYTEKNGGRYVNENSWVEIPNDHTLYAHWEKNDDEPTWNDTKNFYDIPANANYAEAVNVLSSMGIINGYDDGLFRPENTITRAETAAIMVCYMDIPLVNGSTPFSDVPSSHWASGYINAAYGNGIINGVDYGLFDPSSDVKYEQIVKMLVASMGTSYVQLANNHGGYPHGYIYVANQEGITEGVPGYIGQSATRATVAMLIYNTMKSN